MFTAYQDRNSHTFLLVGKNKGRFTFITLDESIYVVKKGEDFVREELHELSYLGEPYPEERAMRILIKSTLPKSPEAERIIRNALGQRIITIDFSARKVGSRSTPKDKRIALGLVSLATICHEIQMETVEARVILRSTKTKKPGGRWEWPEAEVPRIKKLLNSNKE